MTCCGSRRVDRICVARVRAASLDSGARRRRCSCRWSSASAGWTVLLTQRAATLKDHAGQVSFPGGRIEPQDEGPWRAALREAHEEIGLSAELRRVRRLPARSLGRDRVSRDAGGCLRQSARSSCASPPPRFTTRSRCRCNSSWTAPTTSTAAHAIRRHDDRGLGHSVRRSRHLGRDRRNAAHVPAHAAGDAATPRAMSSRLEELLAIMERLRAPDGCPWDREQTFASIAPYTIEEAYEVADADRAAGPRASQGRARRSVVPSRVPCADGARARRV